VFIFIALAAASLSHAQQIVSIPYSDYSSATQQVDAVISVPKSQANGKAVILLHGAGGYKSGTTQQYASLFTSNGYIALRKAGGQPSKESLPNVPGYGMR
jgi:hypothetical protein